MWKTNLLEPPREALHQSTMDEKRSRAQNDHLQRKVGRRVLVPQALDRFRPPHDLLNLINGEDRSVNAGVPSEQTRPLPLRPEPRRVPQHWFIGRGVVPLTLQPIEYLPHEGRFAGLPRAGNHLNEPPLLIQSTEEQIGQDWRDETITDTWIETRPTGIPAIP